MTLTVGALFAGYGGIELALSSVVETSLSWYAEFDDAPSRILAHRNPGVPNLRDVTKVDWSQVEPVDVITGGSPCQDLSHAGKRAGMKAGTRSGLWASMCDAIDIIRPRLVVWENVRGALSAEADSELEPCPGCMGGGDDGPVLRALGRVLGDLAELGYDARWYGLRAADVGAPHERFRIFLFATPTDSGDHAADHLTRSVGVQQGSERRTRTAIDSALVCGGRLPAAWDLGPSLDRWGAVGPALARWAAVIGRTPPSIDADYPLIAEFLMGLPEGHVTSVPGVTRSQALKALGNGVVPQQCAAAFRAFLTDTAKEAAA